MALKVKTINIDEKEKYLSLSMKMWWVNRTYIQNKREHYK